jgi:phosphate transport system substrate-binding protein
VGVSQLLPADSLLPGIGVLTAAVLLCGACGTPAAGNVVVSGSSTVEPITIAVAEQFAEIHQDVNVFVDGPGTGDGFELFCDGETDINDASSPIADEQIEACARNGVEFIELRIGNDGIVMLTDADNDAVDCLAVGDIYALVGPESQGIDTWNAADDLAAEVGGVGTLPDMPLSVTGPGEESGTYVSFVELALEDIATEREQQPETRADYQSSADDNVILQGIQGSPGSLGWVGYAFAKDAEGIRVLEVDGGAGCIAPGDETISTNEYPLSRPLYIYVNAQRAQDEPALVDFVDLYLGEAIGSVAEVGYVPQTDEALAETARRWESRTTGVADPVGEP